MLSRALSLATVALLIGCFAAIPVQAQNLEAGKSPSQIFAGTCSACHKSPRGLLKTVPPGSLPGFLRQHYTTSPDMANVLSSYLVSNGVNDTRFVGAQPKGGKDGAKDGVKDGGKDGGKDGAKEAKSEARPEAKPDARPSGPPDQLDRFGRRQHPAAVNQEAARPDARPDARPEARSDPRQPDARPESRPEARPDSEPREAARPDAEEGGAPQSEPSRPGHTPKRHDAKRLARPAEAPEDGARPDAAARPDGARPDGAKRGADGQVPAQ